MGATTSGDREIVGLDMNDNHVIVVTRDAGGRVRLALEHREGDRRSVAHDTLARQLRVLVGTESLAFDPRTRTLDLDRRTADEARVVARLEDDHGDLLFATIPLERGNEPARQRYALSPLEVRYASDNGRLHAVPAGARSGSALDVPTTDLHTHAAGCVRSAELVAIGAAHGVTYPALLLEEAGLRVASPNGGAVALAELSPRLCASLARRLEVPLDRRITFREMERIYRFRSPITKHRAT